MMNENTINLLLQIPLAGVVVLVVILFLRHLREITNAFMASQEKLTVMFMESIKEQRTENIKALADLSREIDTLDKNINERLNSMEIDLGVRSKKKPT